MVSPKDFVGQDVLSLYDWPREKIEYVFKVAEKMEPIVRNRTKLSLLADKNIAVCFYSASTRTRTSFQSAASRLGAHVIGWESPGASRARDQARVEGEGETDKDTAKMLEGYADAIVVRHDKEGGPKEMAKWASVPVLNGGDGPNGPTSEHPTQGLLDLYTIRKEQGKIDGLNILALGSQANLRGGHSFSFGLAKFNSVKEYICAPTPLQPEHEKLLKGMGLDFEYVDEIKDVVGKVDVIIGGGREEKYILRALKLLGAKDNLIVMNQLPRGTGIAEDVDDTKYARYYEEAWNGIPVRMALLALAFGREL